jgi:RNA polymerase primary sigma factor
MKAGPGAEANAALTRFVADELAGSGLLDVLPKREQIIILARFGLDGGKPKTLEEIGKQFGVTRERIRQLQNAALSKLSRARATRSNPT